jgi:predicted phosphodiesterase
MTILDIKSKVLIIGDIHGCLVEFKDLLNKSNYNDADTSLILVGDLVNKGPYSAEVVKYARSLNAYCVRGNHDDSALSLALSGIKQNNFIDDLNT